MSKFEESNFYKALQDFFINADKKTFLQFLAEFYNRTEGIIDKDNIQDDLIKELRELYLELNEKGIDENIVKEKVNYFLENSVKIKNIISKLTTITNNIKNISSQLDANIRELDNSKVELDVERKRIDSFTSLPEGSTTGDAELIDGRVGANGKTYENIGTAIREQFKNVNKTTDDLLKSYVSTFRDLSINVLDNWIEISGATSDYNNYKHVEIVGVKTGEIYKIKNQCGSNVRAYILKNASGEVVSSAPEQSYGTKNNYTLEITIPHTANGGTLYINTFKADYIGVQIVTGTTINSLKLANKNIFMQSNLYGKKIIFFGDSITANKGSWGDGDTIRAKYKMTGNNYAVGGMTYSVRSDSNDTNNIYLRMQSKLSDILDADYICFQGGTNDAFRGVPLGEILDENDFTTELNTSTFAGAFEMSCRLLRTQVPSAKLLYLVNLKIPRNKNLKNYVEIAKKICNKYSIQYLDLWNNSGLNPAIQSINDKYYSIDPSISAEHGDQTHPTVKGYKVHLNDKVDFALNSL